VSPAGALATATMLTPRFRQAAMRRAAILIRAGVASA
jgi:hypothetical protein